MKKIIVPIAFIVLVIGSCVGGDPKVQEDIKAIKADMEKLKADHAKLRDDHENLVKDAFKAEVKKEDAMEGSKMD